MAKVSNNRFPQVVFTEQASPPTPQTALANGEWLLYMDTDDSLYVVNHSGTGTAVVLANSQGTYTPTLTNTTNVAASAVPGSCWYYRIGNIVTVGGIITIDVTSAAATELGMTIPIASNFANYYELAGTASTGSAVEVARIAADTTNDRARWTFVAVTTANVAWAFMFSYQVI